MQGLKSPCTVGIFSGMDGGADVSRLKTNCGDRLAPRPPIVSRAVALASCTRSRHGARTHTLELAAPRSHSLLIHVQEVRVNRPLLAWEERPAVGADCLALCGCRSAAPPGGAAWPGPRRSVAPWPMDLGA